MRHTRSKAALSFSTVDCSKPAELFGRMVTLPIAFGFHAKSCPVFGVTTSLRIQQ